MNIKIQFERQSYYKLWEDASRHSLIYFLSPRGVLVGRDETFLFEYRNRCSLIFYSEGRGRPHHDNWTTPRVYYRIVEAK